MKNEVFASNPADYGRNVLSATIEPSIPIAILDFPDYSNVGDSAIWAGELKFLHDGCHDIRYVCDIDNFSEVALRRRMPFGQILLQGGGNFGDIWPKLQAFREMVIQRFPDYRIVQLPQSIHFREKAALERARQRFAKHENFTALVRDKESLAIATDELGLQAKLCPDSALMLAGTLTRATPRVDVLVLARSDQEIKGEGLAGFSVPGAQCEVVDWLDESRTWLQMATRWVKAGALSGVGGNASYQRLQKKLFSELAKERIARGVEILSRGRIVVTDRLHAHILCTLLGIPHVVLDNEYGKIGRFIKCWYPNHPLFESAQDRPSAQLAARKLLDAQAGQGR